MALLNRVLRSRGLSSAVRQYSVTAQAVTVKRPGHPLSSGVLSAKIGAKDVVVRMLAAPISPLDLTTISSGQFKGQVAGNEGIGIVEAKGSGVSNLKEGDTVVATLPGNGTWATHSVSSSEGWTAVPDVKSLGAPVEVAAAAFYACATARTLVEDSKLTSGATLIQTNAGSTVGQAVIQYAAARGVKTVNILRKNNDWADIVNHLQGLGAGVVVDEDYAATPAFRKLLADFAAPTVAFDSVGGAITSVLAKSLAPQGVIFSYGNSSGRDIHLSSSHFTEKGLRLVGFSLPRWLQAVDKADRDAAARHVLETFKGNNNKEQLQLLVAREPFAQFSHALKRSYDRGERKVVLTMSK